MEKEEARREIRRRIEALTPSERAAKSEAVRARLLSLPEMSDANTIMAFLAMPDELDTRPMIEAMIAAGKRVYVPHTLASERRMIPVRIKGFKDLRTGAYGIAEPDSDETCRPEDIDFIIVPARAFDRRGNRLGRGAGFYDRFMTEDGFRAVRCGIGFACQVLPSVPQEAHDLPVQILVTEDEVLRMPHR